MSLSPPSLDSELTSSFLIIDTLLVYTYSYSRALSLMYGVSAYDLWVACIRFLLRAVTNKNPKQRHVLVSLDFWWQGGFWLYLLGWNGIFTCLALRFRFWKAEVGRGTVV